jgi:hypothetical protein
MDHGYPVNEEKRCIARTQKQRQCSLPPLLGIEMCALHAGLARPRNSTTYGDPRALETYKRTLAARSTQTRQGRVR